MRISDRGWQYIWTHISTSLVTAKLTLAIFEKNCAIEVLLSFSRSVWRFCFVHESVDGSSGGYHRHRAFLDSFLVFQIPTRHSHHMPVPLYSPREKPVEAWSPATDAAPSVNLVDPNTIVFANANRRPGEPRKRTQAGTRFYNSCSNWSYIVCFVFLAAQAETD